MLTSFRKGEGVILQLSHCKTNPSKVQIRAKSLRLKKGPKKKVQEKVRHIKSHTKMKNKKSHEEDLAEVAQNLARLFMSATTSLRNIFCIINYFRKKASL